MSINHLIINFHNFLIDCWPNISEILKSLDWDESPYFIENWIQANWELLVEKPLLESGYLLVPYGYDDSIECRYTDKKGVLTHRVRCKKKFETEPQYYFLCFVAKADGVYKIEPPFDFIDVENINTGDRLSLAFEDVEFFVDRIR